MYVNLHCSLWKIKIAVKVKGQGQMSQICNLF